MTPILSLPLIIGYLMGALTAPLWPAAWRLLFRRRRTVFDSYYPDDVPGRGRGLRGREKPGLS